MENEKQTEQHVGKYPVNRALHGFPEMLNVSVRQRERKRKMTPGPTIIRRCSACGKHIAQHTIGSGNTIGARFWTDGKQDAPMLPDQPWLIKCPHCSTLGWIDEQEPIGEIDRWRARIEAADKFRDARSGTGPTLPEYIAFLSAGVESGEKERYVRLRIWWAGNDTRRYRDHAKPLTEVEAANLRAFSALCDEKDDNDRLMKAEAFRELGMFEEAEGLLATQFEEEFMEAVGIIRSLNQNRNAAVAEMKFR